MLFPSPSFHATRRMSPWVWISQTLLIWFLFGGSALAAPTVSSYLKIQVPTGAGFVSLFELPAPAACSPGPPPSCPEQRVMLAKLVVNETIDNLVFQILPSDSKYDTVNFSTENAGVGLGGNKNMTVTGGGTLVATVRARFTTETAYSGFRVLTIAIRFDNSYDSFAAGETFAVLAKQTATEHHFYGFRVDNALDSTPELATANPLVTKPYLIRYVTDAQLGTFGLFTDFPSVNSIDFGEVHISLPDTYTPKEYYEFRNVGTAPLKINGVTPGSLPIGGAYTIENYPLPPLEVLPMAELRRLIKFQPTVLGPVADPVVKLTTNAGELQLNLQNGRGIQLNSAIVMDLSTSMLWDSNNTPTSVMEDQKIYNARLAALELSELYLAILPKANLGLYSFPNLSGACPTAQQHVSLSVIDTNIEGYRKRLNANLVDAALLVPPPNTGTPLAEGMKKAWDILYPTKSANTRAAVFLFGDGEHNCNSAAPNPTPADWYNSSQFQDGGIPFFTIPYGAAGAGWLNTYAQIALNSGGTAFAADVTSKVELQKQFKKALGKALDLETLKDPTANITAGGSASHAICTTSSAHQLVFSVNWADKNAEAVEVKVEAPDHTILTPSAVTEHPGHVSYTAGETFANYVVRGKFLQGDAGTGIWKIHVKGNQATSYVYQSFAMDRMKTKATLDWDFLAEIPTLVVKFPGGPYAVAAAGLTARIQEPTVSVHNYLANTPVTPEQIARIPENLAAQWGPMEKKLYALKQAGKAFDPKWAVEEKRFGELEPEVIQEIRTAAERPQAVELRGMVASTPATSVAASLMSKAIVAGEGFWAEKAYELPLEAAKVSGYYNVIVSVNGLATSGQCFEREYTFGRFVDVKVSIGHLAKNLKWEEALVKPFFPPDVQKLLAEPPPEGMLRKAITFTPADDEGNVFGMGRADEIALSLQDATALGALVDNYDGSYTQLVQYNHGTKPAVQVAIGDVKSEALSPSEPVVPPPNGISWFWIVLLLVIVIVVAVYLLRSKK